MGKGAMVKDVEVLEAGRMVRCEEMEPRTHERRCPRREKRNRKVEGVNRDTGSSEPIHMLPKCRGAQESSEEHGVFIRIPLCYLSQECSGLPTALAENPYVAKVDGACSRIGTTFPWHILDLAAPNLLSAARSGGPKSTT
ncbi:hypothetical protein R1flu_011243 [Riccia fluitans]|uniref:Uncharacterized protein n=1 Tax=Riccia fluitans TaxID=41844 RepID=A0ABD1Z792_9MARC